MSTPTPTINVKASVLHGAKDLRIERRKLSLPSDDEVQVAILTTGLCGSDLHYFNHFRNGDIKVLEPLTLGHESAGIVKAVGPGVIGLKVGDRVALEVGLPCGICDLCAEGRYNICKDLRFRSSAKSSPHFQGTLQERINHPAERCFKLPDGVSLTMGALVEPLAVAMHASRRASLPTGSKVLVFGAGSVGLLCAAISKTRGHSVIIADIQAERVDFAVSNGFADAGIIVPLKQCDTIDMKLKFAKMVAAIVAGTHLGHGQAEKKVGEVDAVFECTGQESCLQSAIYATRPGGKIMLIGMGNPVQTLPISAAALREVDLIGVFRYANMYEDAIRLIASKDPLLADLSKLVTQRFAGFENIGRAFDVAAKVKDADGKLVLKVLVETPEV